MTAAIALTHRELLRFVRQRSRVIGALVTPLVFWVLIGAGMGRSFAGPSGQVGYASYFFPGTVMMVVLFTAIFSTISLIEDRREGFLQGVLVSPVSRLSVVLGKVLGGTVLAFGQALLFLLLAPLVGYHVTAQGILLALLVLALAGFAITGLGLAIAWPMESTQGFHVVMNLLLMPMWFLSGALFPLRGDMWLPMKVLMYANPMTYLLAALRHAMAWQDTALRAALPPLWLCLLVGAVFAAIMLAGCVRLALQPARA